MKNKSSWLSIVGALCMCATGCVSAQQGSTQRIQSPTASSEALIADAVAKGDMYELVVSPSADSNAINMVLQQHWKPMGDSDAQYLTSNVLPDFGLAPGSTRGQALIQGLSFDAKKKFLSFKSGTVGGRHFDEACYYQGQWYVRK
jgi:hypothetical protein